MQKKPSTQNNPSNWESNLKKQQQKDTIKKVVVWGGIALVCVLGLVGLVKLAGNSGPSSAPTTENSRLRAVSATNDIILGKPDAKVTIVEYADFQCPACAAYNPVVNKLLSDYDGKIRVVYRFFPLTNIHKNSHISGQAGYAAWKLGKFHEMKDELFSNQSNWENLGDPREVFIEYAKSVGMDPVKFAQIMNSNEAKNAVNTGEAEALGLGLNSTPSFFIDKKQFSPTGYDSIKKLIDGELSGVSQAPTTQPLQ